MVDSISMVEFNFKAEEKGSVKEKNTFTHDSRRAEKYQKENYISSENNSFLLKRHIVEILS